MKVGFAVRSWWRRVRCALLGHKDYASFNANYRHPQDRFLCCRCWRWYDR